MRGPRVSSRAWGIPHQPGPRELPHAPRREASDRPVPRSPCGERPDPTSWRGRPPGRGLVGGAAGPGVGVSVRGPVPGEAAARAGPAPPRRPAVDSPRPRGSPSCPRGLGARGPRSRKCGRGDRCCSELLGACRAGPRRPTVANLRLNRAASPPRLRRAGRGPGGDRAGTTPRPPEHGPAGGLGGAFPRAAPSSVPQAPRGLPSVCQRAHLPRRGPRLSLRSGPLPRATRARAPARTC